MIILSDLVFVNKARYQSHLPPVQPRLTEDPGPAQSNYNKHHRTTEIWKQRGSGVELYITVIHITNHSNDSIDLTGVTRFNKANCQ